MSDAMLEARSTALQLGAFRLDRTCLVVQGSPPFEEWERVGAFLQQVEGAVSWWVGDWVNFGEAAYGERYSQALDATGLAYQTVADYAWTARKVDVSRRKETLAFSVHKEVACLPADDQAAVLAEAESHQWSVWQTRHAVRQRRDGRTGELPERYVLDEIPPELWRGVQAKAAVEGASLRAVLLRLLREWVQPSATAGDGPR